jgi:hypothetical protein
MRLGRPTPALLLTKGERDALQAWTRQSKCPQALALRARVILLGAAGRSNTETADELQITTQTVGKWRQRFVEKRLDGLLDSARAARPAASRVSATTPGSAVRPGAALFPEGHQPGTSRKLSKAGSATSHAAHWSTRSLAEAGGPSRASVHRLWRAFSLQPQRAETFRLLKDSLLVDKRTLPGDGAA